MKWWCSGERLKGLHISKDFVEWEPTHKLALQTNHKPSISDNSDGAWRRLRLVPWQYKVPDEKRVDDLAKKLMEKEAAGTATPRSA